MSNQRDLQNDLLQGQADAQEYTVRREYRLADPRVSEHVEASMRGAWLRGEPRENPAEAVRDSDRLERFVRRVAREARHGR